MRVWGGGGVAQINEGVRYQAIIQPCREDSLRRFPAGGRLERFYNP